MHLRLSTLIVLALAAPLAAQDAAAEKVLKKVLKDALKQHAQAVKSLLVPTTSILKETKSAAAAGVSAPGDSVDAVAGTLNDFDLDLSIATSATVLTDVSTDLDAALIEAGLPLPAGALIGTGGLLDKRLALIDRRHERALGKSRRASRAVLKALKAQGLEAALRTPDTSLPAFAPGFFGSGPTSEGGIPGGFVLPQLQLTALVGYSEGDQVDDGALQITGFTLEPEAVKLSGAGPMGSGFGPIEATPDEFGRFELTVTGLREGNWRVQALQSTKVTDVVGIPGAPDPGTDPATPQQEAQHAKLAWKELTKKHGQLLAAQGKAFRKLLKAARAEIKAGEPIEGVLDGVYAGLEQFQQLSEVATNGAQGAAGVATETFGAALDGLDQLVEEQLVGAGLANDKSSARLQRRVQRETDRVLAGTRAFGKFLAKQTDWRLATGLNAIPLRHAAPVKGPELLPQVVPLRFELLQGSSRQGVDDDGVLRMRLRADASLGQRVDLVLFGPDGFVLVDTLDALSLEGGDTQRYPEEGPGTLPEGNYVVVLQQNSVLLSAAISVPGAD